MLKESHCVIMVMTMKLLKSNVGTSDDDNAASGANIRNE